MSMTRRLLAPARLAAVLAFLVPALGYAHIAEFEAVLDTAQEIPPPVGTNPGAGGTGTFVLEDDGTVDATVTFQGLTAVPFLAHIHEAPPGVAGGIIVDFSPLLSGVTGTAGTIAGTGSVPLTSAQQQTLFAGGMYFNIHTPPPAGNPAGEIRGQIRLKPGTCSCNSTTPPKQFKQCVRRAIQQVEKAERRERSVKDLRRLVAKAACGKTTAPRRTVACCFPLTPAQNIVTDRICATVKQAQCTKLNGTSAGTGVACSPYPCGSPSGAFVEASTD